MSIYSDWDLVYGVTYKALNRKLARVFQQQRSQKHQVKQVVALVLDPAHQGLTGGYLPDIVAGGTYTTAPELAVSYFDEQHQQQRHVAAPPPVCTAELDGNGRLSRVVQLEQPHGLLYPPGIEVRRQPTDPPTGEAVVLTSLAIGAAPLTATGTLQQVLADWLADDRTNKAATGNDRRVLSVLHRHFTGRLGTDTFNTARNAARAFVLQAAGTRTYSDFCGDLLEHLVGGLWAAESFWQSSYLQTLAPYKDVQGDELRALYAYAVKLRNQTSPDAGLLQAGSTAALRAAIEPVYEYYRASEVAQLKREAVFRAQEALLRVEFDFANNTLQEVLLSALLANNSRLVTAVAQALLEVFACLVPTVMPDLLFGVRDLGSSAQVFSIRLGAWQMADSKVLGKFGLTVPVLGGIHYEQRTGALQVLNDAHIRLLNAEYKVDFFTKAHQDPGLQIKPDQFNLLDYFGFTSTVEQPNSRVPASYGYPDHPTFAILSDDDTRALLQSLEPPADDPTKHGYRFSYSYYPLFSVFNVLDDLPVTAAHRYANMGWAKVTEYRFVFWTNTKAAGTLTGQLYICGSVRPEGSTTQEPLVRGGELNTLQAGNDSFLYVSRALLAPHIFLPNVASAFYKPDAAGKLVTTTVADFYVESDEVKNKVAVHLPYEQMKAFLSPDERQVLQDKLKMTDADSFVIPAQGIVFGTANGKLRLTLSEARYKNSVTFFQLELTFRYSFVRRNGLERYQLLSSRRLGSMQVDYQSTWDFMAEWAPNVVVFGAVIAGTGVAVYKLCKQPNELDRIVPAGYEHPQRHEVDRMLNYLEQRLAQQQLLPPPGPEQQPLVLPVQIVDVAPNNLRGLGEAIDYALDGTFEDNSIREFLDEEAGKAPANPSRPDAGPVELVQNPLPALANPTPEDQALARLATKYSRLVHHYMAREVAEQQAVSFYPEHEIDDERLLLRHRVSLSLKNITEDYDGKKRVSVRFTDNSYNRQTDHLESTRQIDLHYTYPIDRINELQYERVLATGPESTELYSQLTGHYEGNVRPPEPADLAAYREIMYQRFRHTFRREIWRVLLRTAYERSKADNKWSTFARRVGATVLGVTSTAGLLVWTSFITGRQAAAKAGLDAALNQEFIDGFLRSQLNRLKYPYEEHFAVNQLLLDQDGLKVTMGALTSRTLAFASGLATEQSVSTYLNVLDVQAITLSVAELQDVEFNRRSGPGKIPFTIRFAYAAPSSPDQQAAGQQERYTTVGETLRFTLEAAASRAAGHALTWTLTPASIAATAFGKIEGANVLLVSRTAGAALEADERNTLIVGWG